MKNKITIFTGLSKLGKDVFGTAVIYQQIAHILKLNGFKISIVATGKVNLQENGIKYFVYNKYKNKKIINRSDIVVFGAYPPVNDMIYAHKKKKKIITYLWSIAPIGGLEFKDTPNIKTQKQLYSLIVDSYNKSLEMSDKIFCRDEKVKNLILGSLISTKKTIFNSYLKNRNFNNILETAGFGISQKKPKQKNKIFRNVIQGITEKDFIMVWNGGVWNWHDSEYLIKIMKFIWEKNKDIKLIFQGFYNPQSKHILSQEAIKVKKNAKKHHLIGKNIFFSKKWVNYEERADYLLDSNASIVISPNIPEANYFIKTRFYDSLWINQPIILNPHESFSKEVADNNIGLVLGYRNANDDAKKIIKFAKNKKLQNQITNNIKIYKKNLTWEKQLKPVLDFCKKIS